MKWVLPVLVAGGLAFASPASASQSVPLPPPPSTAWCQNASQVKGAALHIPGFGEAIAACMNQHHMSRDARNCLIALAITTAGVVVGGIIAGVAARAIAGSMITNGTAVCVGIIIAT